MQDGARVVRHARAITSSLAAGGVNGTTWSGPILTAIQRLPSASVMVRERILTKLNESDMDSSVHRAENGDAGPEDAVRADPARSKALARPQQPLRAKTLDQRAKSGDLTSRRQATWGMSV